MIIRQCLLAASAITLIAAPAIAQQSAPIVDRDPSAVDVAKTPVTDLNIDKQEIPQALINAQIQPYDLTGIGKCSDIITAVNELDSMLGPDIDLPQEARDRISAGRVAKTVVGSFIPFRGLIREVSGANAHEREIRAAIQAGMTRRGFLKGVGIQRKCAYPARSATADVIAAVMAEREAVSAKDGKAKDSKEAPAETK